MSDLPAIETARLFIRPRTHDDIDALVVMHGDPDVMRFVGDGTVLSEPERRAAVIEGLASPLPDGLGIWSVFPRAAHDDLLGSVFLVPLPDTDLIEIGWRFRRDAWGQGVATEAASAILDYGFADLALDEIVAVVYLENTRSIRVIEKLGLKAAGTCFAYGQDLPIFRLKRPTCS